MLFAHAVLTNAHGWTIYRTNLGYIFSPPPTLARRLGQFYPVLLPLAGAAAAHYRGADALSYWLAVPLVCGICWHCFHPAVFYINLRKRIAMSGGFSTFPMAALQMSVDNINRTVVMENQLTNIKYVVWKLESDSEAEHIRRLIFGDDENEAELQSPKSQ